MRNHEQSWPGELEQLLNFFEGRRLIYAARVPHSTVRPVLSGLMSIIPEQVIESRIFQNQQVLAVGKRLFTFQMALNDEIDFRSLDKQALRQAASEKVNLTRQALDEEISLLDDPARKLAIKSLIRDYIAETELVEENVRQRAASDATFSFEDALQYRRIVNAIASCTVTAVLLGHSYFQDSPFAKMRVEKSVMSWEDVVEKYKWIFSNTPQAAPVLRAVQVMDRIATAAQLDDDLHGRDIDKLLAIPSPVLVALSTLDSIDDVREMLQAKKDELRDEAKQLGLGILPTMSTTIGFKQMQRVNEFLTKKGRRWYRILAFLENRTPLNFTRRFPPRERAYITGEL